MSLEPRVPATNRLLAALPALDRKRLLANAQSVELALDEVICTPGESMRFVYFPTASFVSVAISLPARAGLEVALIGSEGMLGLSAALGVDASSLHALVQGAGGAIRMTTPVFRRELARSTALQRGVNRYLYVSMALLAQTAACTRFHLLEARLARWLMTTSDRAHSNEFRLTHESLATKLGVRRVGITTAAGSLQQRGLIRYRRGRITILDRAELERVTCECYRAGQLLYDRILGR